MNSLIFTFYIYSFGYSLFIHFKKIFSHFFSFIFPPTSFDIHLLSQLFTFLSFFLTFPTFISHFFLYSLVFSLFWDSLVSFPFWHSLCVTLFFDIHLLSLPFGISMIFSLLYPLIFSLSLSLTLTYFRFLLTLHVFLSLLTFS